MGYPASVRAVTARPISASLVTETTPADMQLIVDDPTVFNEAGGEVRVDADGGILTVPYSTVLGDSLILAAPIGEVIDASTLVIPLPRVMLRVATLILDGDEDSGAVEAVIEPSIAAHVLLSPGVLDEPVDVWVESGGVAGFAFTVVRMLSHEPALDADVLSGHAPVEVLTDGEPPESAPVVTVAAFGIGGVEAHWPRVENRDPVAYRVYASPVLPVVMDETTHICTTASTSCSFTAYPDSDSLPPGEPVHVVVVAFDADGDGPVSDPASGEPRQASNEDIASEFVYAGSIEANQIRGGSITATQIGVGDGIVLDGTDSSITIYGSSGAAQVRLAPDASVWRSRIESDEISALGAVILKSDQSQISGGGGLTLAAGVDDPLIPLSVSYGLAETLWPAIPAGFKVRGIQWDSVDSCWIRLMIPTSGSIEGRCRVQRIDDDGVLLSEVTLGNVIGLAETDFNSIVRHGDHYYTALYYDKYPPSRWYVAKFDAATGAFSALSSDFVASVEGRACLSSIDGGTVSLMYTRSGDLRRDAFATSDLVRSASNQTWITGFDGHPQLSFVYLDGLSGPPVDPSSADGAVVTRESIHLTESASTSATETQYVIGLAHDGMEGAAHKPGDWWYSLAGSRRVLGKYGQWQGAINDDLGPDSRYAYANTAGGHTTAAISITAALPPPWRHVTYSLPPAPNAAPNADIFFAAYNLGLGQWVDFKRSLSSGARHHVVDPIDGERLQDGWTLAAPPTTNTFPAGATAFIRSSVGGFEVKGDGEITVPTPTLPDHAASKAYVDAVGGVFGLWRLQANVSATTGSKFTLGDFYPDPDTMSADIGEHVQLHTSGGRDVWTILKAGTYRIVIKVKWNANSSGHRYIYPRIDNVEVDNISAGPGNGAMLTLVYEFPAIGLDVGQDLRFQTMQNSGSTRQIVGSASGYDTSVYIQRIGEKA